MISTLIQERFEQKKIDETIEEETGESTAMGSFNHGYVQMRVGSLLPTVGNFTPVSELTLDVAGLDLSKFDIKSKEEIKPDICLYPKRKLSRPQDILRMREMPLLAVEIVSPKQGTYELIEKIKVYFELGVQSCWLIEPAINAVTVYASIDDWETYTKGDVIDSKLKIQLPISEIFG